MQYYPQHYFGFAVDGTVAERLQLNEAFDNYEMSYEEEDFFDGFEEKYGVLPESVRLFDYDESEAIRDLCGFEWDRPYVLFEDYQEGTPDWEKLSEILEEEDVSIDYGNWSEEEN